MMVEADGPGWEHALQLWVKASLIGMTKNTDTQQYFSCDPAFTPCLESPSRENSEPPLRDCIFFHARRLVDRVEKLWMHTPHESRVRSWLLGESHRRRPHIPPLCVRRRW